MPNSFDTDPRGPSNGRLFVLGVIFLAVAFSAATLMVAKSQGRLENVVRVDVMLVNVGDGLPPQSDVKFRNLLVGSVTEVTPSTHGRPNVVHVAIKPEFAGRIPDTVTARVVPANLFAVSAVQLVDNGGGGRLRSGAVISEDRSLQTVIFQDVLSKLRQLIGPLGRRDDDRSIGVIAALGEATHGRGGQLTDTGHDLNEVLAQLNTVIATDDTGPTTLTALTDAAQSLQQSAPELFDALDQSLRPMATVAEKRRQLTDLLTGGVSTAGTVATALENQSDRMITISTQFSPPLGVIADHADEFHGVSKKLEVLANKLYDEVWDPDVKILKIKAAIAFTASRTYVRADCPRYGELAGPSCATAPETPTAPDLYPALESRGVTPTPGMTENRPNLTPPRHSMPGDPQGPPLPGPLPGPPPSAPPDPTPDAPATARGEPPAATGQSAAIGGNVGPVGSPIERQQISRITGTDDVGTVLLLGPLVRGATVYLSHPDRKGDR